MREYYKNNLIEISKHFENNKSDFGKLLINSELYSLSVSLITKYNDTIEPGKKLEEQIKERRKQEAIKKSKELIENSKETIKNSEF